MRNLITTIKIKWMLFWMFEHWYKQRWEAMTKTVRDEKGQPVTFEIGHKRIRDGIFISTEKILDKFGMAWSVGKTIRQREDVLDSLVTN